MILVEKCELQGMLPSIDFLNIASASRCQYKSYTLQLLVAISQENNNDKIGYRGLHQVG